MQRRNFIFASALVPLFKTVLAQDILVQQIPVRPIKPATFYWLDAPGLTIFWSETFLQVVRSSEFDSPMVARSMAIVHTAMYNAWACFDDQLTATLDIADIKQLTATHNLQNQLVAMSYAAYTTLLAQFPKQEKHIHAVMQELHFPVKAKNAPAIYAKAAWVGERIAQMVLIERLNDASNQDGGLSNSHLAFDNYQSYESKNPVLDYNDTNPIDAVLPDIWQPISYINPQGTQVTPAFLVSHWHLVTPFALSSANQFRPPAPAVWGNDAFKTQAEQLLKIQTHLTDEQKVISSYWNEKPHSELPPGQWLMFALEMAKRQKMSQQKALLLCFALSNALLDTSIAVWDAKLFYESARPITVMRHVFRDQTIMSFGAKGPEGGLQAQLGQLWRPYQPNYLPTPASPEYVSEQSAYAAAGAEVLKLFTGSDNFEMSHTQGKNSLSLDATAPTQNVTLYWPTFTAAAEQAGMSGIYGGIHFMAGNLEGLKLGRQVAKQAYQKAKSYWTEKIQ